MICVTVSNQDNVDLPDVFELLVFGRHPGILLDERVHENHLPGGTGNANHAVSHP